MAALIIKIIPALQPVTIQQREAYIGIKNACDMSYDGRLQTGL